MNDWGRLSFIIGEQNHTSRALFLALQPPLYTLLLPEVEPAFWEVAKRGAWQALESARLATLGRLRSAADELQALLAAPTSLPPPDLENILNQRFLAPLGL